MDLQVFESEKYSNHYFIVDSESLMQTAKIDELNSDFKRIQHEKECELLDAFTQGGCDIFQIIRGKSYDFFVALIKETKW